ncbi:uncharacterized protein METZ01_LOCUS229712, partial [marine metagenome]|jgi:heme-degrading monooxygenase HmoA|tara:strand:- start:261 stop:545 length:285 start_codon:yes stop_codon:yes gene_type:complete
VYVVVADIKLKDGVESDFKTWFSKSNEILSKLDGFTSRRLLKAENGSHRIIVEHQSKKTFIKMHESEEHSKLHVEAQTYMTDPPLPRFYEVIAK